MSIRICILSLSALLISSAFAAQPNAPSNPGSPSSTKFWDISDKKRSIPGDIFKGNADKERYFVESVTGIGVEKTSKEIVGPNVDYQYKNVSIFDQIILIDHIDKTERELSKIRKINRFLDTNYNTQILPEEAYEHSGLPRPFYLNKLSSWAFNAIRNSDIKTLRALLNNYNLLHIKNKDGTGLLSYAISFNHNRIARFLIRSGADINEKDNKNYTPLNIAARNNNEIMVGILTKNACNVFHKDDSGKSSADYALMNNNHRMHKHLLSRSK